MLTVRPQALARSGAARPRFPTILHDFEVAGPLARTVADIQLTLSVIADGFAPAAVTAPLRILFAPTFGAAPVDPEIAASLEEAARQFEAMGHSVERAEPFLLAEPMLDIWRWSARPPPQR